MSSFHAIQQALPGLAQYCDSPERNAGTFLRTSAVIFARWFLVMRAAANRERARQQSYREEHGFKKKAKVPALPLVLTDSERDVASLSESAIRAMFGDEVADYASERFSCAMQTGDMRAFKIRLLMLRARDALQGPLQEEFNRWTETYISEAEKAAGCVPCPGPRRLSRAEKNRKDGKRAAEAGSYYEDEWFKDSDSGSESDDEAALSTGGSSGQDSYSADKGSSSDAIVAKKPSRRRRSSSARVDLDVPVADGLPPVGDIVSSMCSLLETTSIEDMAKNIPEESEDVQYVESSTPCDPVTVRSGEGGLLCTVRDNPIQDASQQGVTTHKAREYSTVSEILEDIASGKITAYGSASEIVSDMKRGVLLPHEAMLFISALDKMSDNKRKPRGRSMRSRMKAEQVPLDEDEEDIDNEERFSGEDDAGGGYSYNPSGFGGCYQGDDNW